MKDNIILIFILLFPFPKLGSAEDQVCGNVWHQELVTYCQGVAADKIIEMRDHQTPNLQARLRALPAEVALAGKRLEQLNREETAKSNGNGILKGECSQINSMLQEMTVTIDGLRAIRENIESISKFVAQTIPNLLSVLRNFLKESEVRLDDAIAAQMEAEAIAEPNVKEAIDFSLGALLELKILRHMAPLDAEKIIRNPLSPEALVSDISPFARALFAAALDAEISSGKAIGSLDLVQELASHLLEDLKLKFERLSERSEKKQLELENSNHELEATAQARHAQEVERDALIQALIYSQNELDAIPGRIQHEIWMQTGGGCDASGNVTECHPASWWQPPKEPKEPKDWGPGHKHDSLPLNLIKKTSPVTFRKATL